ncbi:MAG: T9SS type A sorting domain-containing protein [Bacteroidota bacterium]
MRLLATLALAFVLGLPAASAQQVCSGTEGTDFQRVTLLDVNTLPDGSLAALNGGGANLETSQIQDLLANDLVGETIEFTAVILSDPKLSGLASTNDAGIPNRVHYFVRDVTAFDEGPQGYGAQIVDNTGSGLSAQFFVGDIVTICGVVAPFTGTGGYSMQINPVDANAIQLTDDDPIALDDPRLAPIGISIGDLHTTVAGAPAGAETQINWNNYTAFVGNYVRMEGIQIVQGVPDANRPDVLFAGASGDAPFINQYDVSVCYRNDRQADYFPAGTTPECVTDGPFNVPATGFANLQGFLIYQGDDGAFDYATPDAANFVINPILPEDLEITGAPPTINFFTAGPEGILSPNDPFPVEASVQANGDATIAAVVVNYGSPSGGGAVTLEDGDGDGTFTGTIPPFASAGEFVNLTYTVTDSNGINAFATTSYRVFDGPLTSITQIQETANGGEGDSPVGDIDAVAMNIVAIVNDDFVDDAGNRTLILQEDPNFGQFTGIAAFVDIAAAVQVGDEITITEANINENFGFTRLENLTYTVTNAGAGAYGYFTIPSGSIANPDDAEKFESMLLRFESVTITDVNADGDDTDDGFGEWQFTTGTEAEELRVDDLAEAFETDYNINNLTVGQQRDFVQGFLYFSFGNFKLIPTDAADVGMAVAGEDDLVQGSRLIEAYPNPTTDAATFVYTLDAATDVQLAVYDVTGRRVALLVDAVQTGEQRVRFDASDLAPGVYVYRLAAADRVETGKLILAR